MKKRSTDINKWDDPWFSDMTNTFKLVYIYICDKCDNAGVWKVNKRLVKFYIGEEIDWDLFISYMGNRLYALNDEKWWLTKFCDFHYGKLDEKCGSNFIISVINLLKTHEIWEKYLRVDQGLIKGRSRPYKKKNVFILSSNENQEKSSNNYKQEKEVFDEARKKYPGTKNGLDTEFENFKRKHKDSIKCIPEILPAIERQINYRNRKRELNQWVPEWKNFKTWINNRCWEEEVVLPDPIIRNRPSEPKSLI